MTLLLLLQNEEAVSAPAAPSGLTATAESSNRIGITWVDNAEDVAGVNEVQTITFDAMPVAGTFTLTYDEETTAAIAYNADAVAITAALEDTASFESGDVAVDRTGNVITITYQGGLAAMSLPEITATSSLKHSPVAEVEVLSLGGATTGTFVLSYGDNYTIATLDVESMSDSAIESAIEAASGGDVSVADNADGTYTITWSGQPGTVALPMTVSTNSTNGSPSVTQTSAYSVGEDVSITIDTTTEGSPQSWDDTGSEVHRSTDGSSYSLLVDLGANLGSWADEGLTAATRYWYKVRSYNAGGYSAFSNADDDTTFTASGGTSDNSPIVARVGFGQISVDNLTVYIGDE